MFPALVLLALAIAVATIVIALVQPEWVSASLTAFEKQHFYISWSVPGVLGLLVASYALFGRRLKGQPGQGFWVRANRVRILGMSLGVVCISAWVLLDGPAP